MTYPLRVKVVDLKVDFLEREINRRLKTGRVKVVALSELTNVEGGEVVARGYAVVEGAGVRLVRPLEVTVYTGSKAFASVRIGVITIDIDLSTETVPPARVEKIKL